MRRQRFKTAAINGLSSGAAVIVPQESTESFTAVDDGDGLSDFIHGLDDLVFETLMVSFGVIVLFGLDESLAQRGFAVHTSDASRAA